MPFQFLVITTLNCWRPALLQKLMVEFTRVALGINDGALAEPKTSPSSHLAGYLNPTLTELVVIAPVLVIPCKLIIMLGFCRSAPIVGLLIAEAFEE